MKVLVLQHLDVEHPGEFRDCFREDGVHWDVVHLDRGEGIPDLSAYDCMLVMGGPQDVWEEDAHPWLVPEKVAIRQFVAELKRPFLGICLGHQLLADALGGTVAPGTSEVGVMTIAQTPAGRADALLRGLPDPMTVLQWHGAEVTALPADATLLASSADCRVQAFRVGRHAYGLQCHVEVDADMVDEWAAIPAYAASLRRALGEEGLAQLRPEVDEGQGAFRDCVRLLYRNLRKLTAESESFAVSPVSESEGEFGFRPFPKRGGRVTNTKIDRLRDEMGD